MTAMRTPSEVWMDLRSCYGRTSEEPSPELILAL
jgi:hypothetical protein